MKKRYRIHKQYATEVPEGKADRPGRSQIDGLDDLATAFWRLSKWLDAEDRGRSAPARHALRQIEKFLNTQEIEVQDLAGRAFEPGWAVTVIDSTVSPDVEVEVVSETISPIVLCSGKVIQHGQIVTTRPEKEKSE